MKKDIRHLPVFDDDCSHVVGVITAKDIADAFSRVEKSSPEVVARWVCF